MLLVNMCIYHFDKKKTMADTKHSRNGQKMMQTVQLGRELTSICKWLPLVTVQSSQKAANSNIY